MNQMPISECYLSKFNIQPHYHRLIVRIHTQSQIGISTQKGISNSGAYFICNTCNWYTRFVHIKVQVYYYYHYEQQILAERRTLINYFGGKGGDFFFAHFGINHELSYQFTLPQGCPGFFFYSSWFTQA